MPQKKKPAAKKSASGKKPAGAHGAHDHHPHKSPQTRILEAALPDVAFDGWTPELLDRAAARLHLTQEDMQDALPHGVSDLVLHFSDWADEEMMAKLGRKMPDRVRDRITLAVRTRLECLTAHKQAASAAMAYMALPPRNLHLPKMVWKTADRIWRWAGDTSTDYNYYTKRLLLASVLTATGFYWLNDTSEGHEKTWAFLDRRIARVMKLGQKMSQLKRKKA